MKKQVTSLQTSIRDRLINISKESNRDYNSLLRLFFQERFLYRISISSYKSNLILKGAFLLIAKNISNYRPTKDVDFLGSSIPNDLVDCVKIIKEICSIEFDDGVNFLADKITAKEIKVEKEYPGVRMHIPYEMGTIEGYFQIDIGFGDKITGGPIEIDFPTLLDFPAPHLKVYSIESAIAEKFEAIVSLHLETSRMKDFYDILFFAEHYEFKKDLLKEAILTTFNHRETDIEIRKNIFDDKFKADEKLQKYWTAFLERNKLTTENDFSKVVARIGSFIEPVFSNKKLKWNPQKFIWE
jgi:predicted nucleotidyltransferase component of viral defense system